jgi:hypothetical protein
VRAVGQADTCVKHLRLEDWPPTLEKSNLRPGIA